MIGNETAPVVVIDRRSSGWFWAENQVFDSPLSSNAKLVYLCLCRMASSSGRSYPSHSYLAEKTGISVSAVQRSISELICDGRVKRESGSGAGKPNVYRLAGWSVPETEGSVSVTEGSVSVTEGSVSVTEGGSVSVTDKGLPILKDNLRRTRSSIVLTDDAFIAALRSNPAYKHIDIDLELGKMDGFLLTRPGRHKTRRFVVGWLNRADRPIAAKEPRPHRGGDFTDE